MQGPRPRGWHCDVCPGGLHFGSAQEKAQHFVSKRHAIHLDNRHKADRGQPTQQPRQKSKEEVERLKDMAALLKARRSDANALHARQETMLVSLQLLDDRVNAMERVWTARKAGADHQHDEEDDNEEGAWSERKQRLFMTRIYDILKQNGIAQDQVLNVYRWGSRWWGHYSPSSDYDFVVLVRDWDQPSTGNVMEGYNIDMAVYEVNIFQELINMHVPWACVFLSHPPEGILMEHHKLYWDYRATKWLSGVKKNMLKNYSIAKQYWQYGEIKKAKKRIIYVMKHWALAVQMAKDQKVSDRHVINDIAQNLMSTHFPTWKSIHGWYREYADKAEANLKEVAQAHKQLEAEWWDNAVRRRSMEASSNHDLAVVSYIKKYGTDQLLKNLGITSDSMDGGIIALCSDRKESAGSSRIAFECNGGLVLEYNGQSSGPKWKPIAQALPRYKRLYPFYGCDLKRIDEEEMWKIIKSKQVGIEDLSDIEWSRAEGSEMIDGHLGLLFHHGDQWKVHIKAKKYDKKDLIAEFWRLYELQAIREQALNPSWCYIFHLVSGSFPRELRYEEDALVLVGLRDCTQPNHPEIYLKHAFDSAEKPATFNSRLYQKPPGDSHSAATTPKGWLVPRHFTELHDLESAMRIARSQSPLSFRGIVLCNPYLIGGEEPAMSRSSFRRALLLSPAYLWLIKLRALETWEAEGDWDEEEGGEGEIDFVKERTRCLFDLLLLFIQWRSQEQSRNRRGEKGKWKKLRQQRKQMTGSGTDASALSSSTMQTSETSSPSSTAQAKEDHKQEEIEEVEGEDDDEVREQEEERFLQLYPQYRADYLTLKAAFETVCHLVDQRYTELNRTCPSMQEWARECEKERYKPLLFVLKKREFPTTRSFYVDYESVHEARVEKVAYYMLDYIHEWMAAQHTPNSSTQPTSKKQVVFWQG